MYHLLLVAAFLGRTPEPAVSHLVIVGGGPTSPDIAAKALSLAGGNRAKVLIIPQASTRGDVGVLSELMWRKVGAKHVAILDLKDDKTALAAVKQADLIWMSGGSQNRLMHILGKHGLAQAIRERFRRGGVTVGGTSAGAAVMSKIMLNADAPENQISMDLKTAEGLGLCPEVIIDQHWLHRPRFCRLISAVLCHPDAVGIGIDECTAVVVEGRKFEVIGKSHVIVFDARKTKVRSKKGESAAAGNVSMSVLRAGMCFDLRSGSLSR